MSKGRLSIMALKRARTSSYSASPTTNEVAAELGLEGEDGLRRHVRLGHPSVRGDRAVRFGDGHGAPLGCRRGVATRRDPDLTSERVA
jgi:hypothetical protein